MAGKIEHQVEEQCTPSELYLAMLLTYRSEDCPLLYFEGRNGPMPFCDCKIEKGEDGQTVINCEKMEGGRWVFQMGMCWIRYARQQAKSADAQTIERQLWRETGEGNL